MPKSFDPVWTQIRIDRIKPFEFLIVFPKELLDKVSKGANIRNRYNLVPHLTQDTDGKVANLHLDTTNESQEVSPFQESDHKAHINRRAQRHSKHKTEKTKKIHKRSTALVRSVKYLNLILKKSKQQKIKTVSIRQKA